VNRVLLATGLAAAIALAALTLYVTGHPYIPEDAVVERDVQSVPWGPLALTFPIFSWIGDAKGFVLEALIFAIVLVVNRRAWVIAAGAAVTGVWYIVINHFVNRPRPTTAQVLQVTEHPGASSFPSGHTIFICTVMTVLVLCLGYRFLRGWGRVAAWIVAAAVIVANGIARIDVGAHWPTDVLAGALIAAAWISLWLAWDPVWKRIEPDRRRPLSP
jgi:undecaprenyl-diphosphatase